MKVVLSFKGKKVISMNRQALEPTERENDHGIEI